MMVNKGCETMTKLTVDVTYDGLRRSLAEYIKSNDQLLLIDRAYELASKLHFGEKRLSGEDYIMHPLNVAYILVSIHADYETICAALLHDAIELNLISKEELLKEFDKSIVSLIEGVTTINRLNFSGDNEAMIANHRKILVGLSEDVRVIIIKLADRLHNMRTLWVLDEKKQKEKAKETLDILIPIAHRLGMNQMKSELEDLSLRYYKPDAYFSIVEKLNQTKKERDQYVIEMQNTISGLLTEHEINHKIKGRSKSIFSIYKKLDKGRKFSDIYDLLALRVYVDTEEECYQALGIIHAKFKPIPKRFKDYIAMPKTNMYQSLHTTVFGVEEQLFEIQIRTPDMDVIAENGIASHWSYKENGSGKAALQSAMEQKLQFFKTIMEIKNEDISDEDFVAKVQGDVLNENIYVFTPKGDVIELPKGSTPIDFAYRVHSGVGDKMVGAIVNNSIVPLDYELKDNDIIKINTNKNSIGPSKEWINMAKTYQAKNKIKSFFNKIDKDGYLKKGEEIIQKELRKRKLAFSDFFTNDNLTKVFEEIKVNDIEELYVDLGNGKINVSQIMNIILDDTDSKEELILKRTNQKKEVIMNIKNDIIVEGIDDVKISVASCCKPIPEDNIVGYITKGYGISVHRTSCPNIKDLQERIIDVKWNYSIVKKYPTAILVHAKENKNVLLDIIAKTSNNDIVIQSINAVDTNENYMFEVVVSVENVTKLNKYLDSIRKMKNIIDAGRIIK
jgi:GTP diphosphokinase / guanosine-3',5'-bis(diphosphate) 3'-diphosphatase